MQATCSNTLCKKEFYIKPSQFKVCLNACCSRACSSKLQSVLLKGRTPTWLKGKELDEAHKDKLRKSVPSGKESPHWKGNGASYSAKHMYIRKFFGSADMCEKCGAKEKPEGKKQWFEWSNISGEYKRIRGDWQKLCVPCHRKQDANPVGRLTHKLALAS